MPILEDKKNFDVNPKLNHEVFFFVCFFYKFQHLVTFYKSFPIGFLIKKFEFQADPIIGVVDKLFLYL